MLHVNILFCRDLRWAIWSMLLFMSSIRNLIDWHQDLLQTSSYMRNMYLYVFQNPEATGAVLTTSLPPLQCTGSLNTRAQLTCGGSELLLGANGESPRRHTQDGPHGV